VSDPAASDRIALAGSERTIPAGAVERGACDPNETATATVVVRAKAPSAPRAAELAALEPGQREYLTRAEFAEQFGASESDIAAVERFASDSGLTVVSSSRARRSVELSGTIGALAAAFGADLRSYQLGDQEFRGRKGTLSVPAALAPLVTGVFGLDNRPQARSQFRRRVRSAVAAASAFTPVQVATAYAFPTGFDGSGQTIALLELGGGFTTADLKTYFSGLGIAEPSVSSVSVDAGKNAPAGDPNSADSEVLLDIEVAAAIAPGAKIVVYFAPNTDQGFLDAVTTIVHDTKHAPTILSISWGGPEATWTSQAFTNFDAAFADAATLGMTVLVAAGDSGSSDGETDGLAHVDFPASSPHVLACGGTQLVADGAAIESETVWNGGTSDGATGGGISDAFDLPAWQQTANVPPSVNAGARVGRGVPDVAGNADPQSGYDIYVDGSAGVVGGTSAVAPLWAALVARLNQAVGKQLGFLNPTLYASPSALDDIVSGNNGAYTAGPGWDACTGLGSPNGARLLALVTSPPAPVPPPAPSSP
jgi:kumamolisin